MNFDTASINDTDNIPVEGEQSEAQSSDAAGTTSAPYPS